MADPGNVDQPGCVDFNTPMPSPGLRGIRSETILPNQAPAPIGPDRLYQLRSTDNSDTAA